MEKVTIEACNIIGIQIRTTNENGQAMQDIPAAWGKFISEELATKIPAATESTLFAVYTDYESDHNAPYTMIIGCKVKNLDTIPEGMVGKHFEGGNYAKFVSKGDMTKGSVYQTWGEIWQSDLKRKYTADFEIYGQKAQDPTNAEVEILIAI